MPWTPEDQDDFEGFTLENVFDGFILEGKAVFKGNVMFFEGNGKGMFLGDGTFEGDLMEMEAVYSPDLIHPNHLH